MNAQVVRDAIAFFQAGVDRVRPEHLWTPEIVQRINSVVTSADRVVVVGAGKASMAMAGCLEAVCPHISEGIVVVPEGYIAAYPAQLPKPKRISLVEGGHPTPNKAGIKAAQETHALAKSLGPNDLLLALISGGGSSLWAYFDESISLIEGQEVFEGLLRAGADIHEMNTVRRTLSILGGGGLAEAAFPAGVETFLLSDVIGDDKSVIASGPTTPNPTTTTDAIEVLQSYNLWASVPRSIRNWLAEQVQGDLDRKEHTFDHVSVTLLGTNQLAQEAVHLAAARAGYNVLRHPLIEGEARDIGQNIIQEVFKHRINGPTCWIWGGETTVTVRGTGNGGRNQELALAAALVLEERTESASIVLLSGGTDGIDGPTDSAGAWVTSETATLARNAGLDPSTFLENNDAGTFFRHLSQRLMTGPTHTNVMDLIIVLRRP